MEMTSAIGQIKDTFKLITANTASLSAIEVLKQQHRDIEDLFDKIETLGVRAEKSKKTLFNKLADKILLHALIEERFFYPHLKILDAELAYEAVEEHEAVKTLIAKIKRIEPNHVTFHAKLKFLRELVENHVDEEERELFPKWNAAERFEVLDQIGVEIKKLSTNHAKRRSHAS